MDQRGGLQGVADALLAEIVSGEFAQFGVDLGQKPVKGGLVTLSEIVQSESDGLSNFHRRSNILRRPKLPDPNAITIAETQVTLENGNAAVVLPSVHQAVARR